MAQVIWTALAAAALLAAPAQAARKPPPPAAVPAPPPPSVRQAVELWRSGDYAGAVAMWQPFANAGDADAMFNIGQAYKLGRAAPKDMVAARDWYRRAAQKGHLPAQANLGILLFQAGEKPEAIRWLKAAADKNEMRAQYVLGVASWNGDGTPRNLALAYGYLSRAAALGLPEATSALGNLSGQLSPVERANGVAVASSLAGGNGVPPEFAGATALASADRFARDQVIKKPPSAAATARAETETGVYRPGPALGPIVIAQAPPAPRAPPPSEIAAGTITPLPRPAPVAVDRPAPPVVTSVGIPPSSAAPPPPRDPVPVATASAAPAKPAPTPAADAGPPVVRKPEAVVVAAKPAPPVVRPTETAAASPRPIERAAPPPRPAAVAVVTPALGAARPVETAAAAPPRQPDAATPVAAKPVQTASLAPPKVKGAKADVAAPKPALPSGWKVQLGAFSKRAQAEAAWSEVQAKQKALVAKSKPIYSADGSVTKLQIGPFPTKAAARDTCAKIAFSGRACFVTEG